MRELLPKESVSFLAKWIINSLDIILFFLSFEKKKKKMSLLDAENIFL